MLRIGFARKFLAEIRVALPVRIRIAVGQPRKVPLGTAIARVAPVRQRISIRMPQKIRRCGDSGEISALVLRIAPSAARIPVPRRNLQFRVLPIGDRTPSGRERFLQNLRRIDLIDRSFRKYVDGCSQRVVRYEATRVRRVGVDPERGRSVLGSYEWLN